MKYKSKKFGTVDITFVWRTYIHIDDKVQPFAYVSPKDKTSDFIAAMRAKHPNAAVSHQRSIRTFIAWAVANNRLMCLGSTAELWREIKEEVDQEVSDGFLGRMESRINNL